MKKVLVTGANGFIGTAFLKVLYDHDIEVVAVVRNKLEQCDAIGDIRKIRTVRCDLKNMRNLPLIVPDRDIDACIHLAWEGTCGDARADYNLQLENIKGSIELINALAQMHIKRFVAAGTLAEKDVLNYHDTDGATPNAVSMYGIAKIAAHFMTKTQCAKLGVEHIWCQFSNVYGVGNRTDNFVNMACKKMLLGQRAAFTLAEQWYDFIYITDAVNALYHVTKTGHKNTTYFIGSSKPQKLKEYICMIRDAINPTIEIYFGEVPFNGKSLAQEAYDASKLIQDTGFRPEIDFRKGIALTVEWLRHNIAT